MAKQIKTAIKTSVPTSADYVCLSCGGSSHEVVAELPPQPYEGTTASGLHFTAIVRKRLRCNDCGQIGIDKTYKGA